MKKLLAITVLFTAVTLLCGVGMASGYKEKGVSEYVDIRIKGVRAISTIGDFSYLALSSPGYCEPVAVQEILYKFATETSIKVLSYNRYTTRPNYSRVIAECEGIEVIHDRPIRR